MNSKFYPSGEQQEDHSKQEVAVCRKEQGMATKNIGQAYSRNPTNRDPQQRDIAERRHKRN
ncbi:MAG: hypothetical protein IKP91_08295 [Bacteroidaceae bacterium]|nr:hypothetical protein [Bacteroidaceae bacterium]